MTTVAADVELLAALLAERFGAVPDALRQALAAAAPAGEAEQTRRQRRLAAVLDERIGRRSR